MTPPRTGRPPGVAATTVGVTLATVTGEPLAAAGGIARIVEVVLAVYSVIVFATLAGALGAFFLQRRDRPPQSRNLHNRNGFGSATSRGG
jgi:voltage-gated potassium channel